MIRPLFPDGFPPAEPAPTGSWRVPLLVALGLAALVMVLYWPAVDFRLLAFDDGVYVTGNDLVARGLDGANIVRAFSETRSGFYVPVTQMSFMADVELFGMASRGFHFTNILIHSLDMALLLLLLWRMTGSLPNSALAAAFVAFHPLRVESVAWVAERKDVLSVFFLIVSLACYLRYVRTGKWRWYGALFLLFLLGLLAKPVTATLPALLILMDFWPLGRFRLETAEGTIGRRILALGREKIPLIALSGLVSLLTVHFHRAAGGLREGDSFLSRVEHSFSADLLYLYQTLWPRDLVLRFFKAPWDQFSGTLIPATLGVAVITALVARSAGRRPFLAMGWGWYLIAILPLSGVFGPIGCQWISDRFTYIPHIGLAIAFAWTAGTGLPPRFRRGALPVIAVFLVLPLAILSRRQLHFWKDGATLFGKGAGYSRNDPGYLDQFAQELYTIGDLVRAKEQEERILRFAMDSGTGVEIQLNYLTILERMGDRKGAIAQARDFLRRDPKFWKTRMMLADDLAAEERFPEAAVEYRQVLEVPRLKPVDRGYVLEGLGIALVGMGKSDEALACFNEGIREIPMRVSLRYNLARLLAARGDVAPALAQFEEAVRLGPGDLPPRLGLAELQQKAGAVEAAAAQFREVARLAPGKSEAFLAQGRILEMAGSKDEARTRYESALRVPALLGDTHETVRRRLANLP
jgi:tetratricopeptide (TPR) repeat protein